MQELDFTKFEMSSERKEGKLGNYERQRNCKENVKDWRRGGGRSERKVGLNRRKPLFHDFHLWAH